MNELFEKVAIPKVYMKLAIPVVMSSVLMLVYNMMDTFFIARTGITNLVAGISLCAPIFTLMVALGDILGLGGASVISRLLGQGKKEDGRRLTVFCLYGAVVIGLVFFAVLLAGKNTVLSLLGADEETVQYAEAYYKWIAYGAPLIIFSLVPTNLLRTEGLANEAMVGSIIGSVANIILDPIFIFTFKMGAAGAAIATVLGNVCADCWYIHVINSKSDLLSLDRNLFGISGEEMKALFGIGIPSSITNIMSSIGVALLNNNLVTYGNDKVAAMGIVSKVTMIVIMIMVGFSFGGQPLFGYLYGSRNFDRLKKSMRFAYTLVIGAAVVLSAVFALCAPAVIGLFMKEASIVTAGSQILRTVLAGMPFTAFVMVTTCVFQSAGKALPSLILSAGRQGVFYVAILIAARTLFGYTGVISAQPVSDVFTAVIAFFILKNTLLKEFKEA